MCAFIVKKNIHGKEYFYLNENKRVEGKVKTKTLAYLGKNKKEAEKKAKEILEKPKEKKEVKKLIKLVKKDISINDMATFCKRKGFVYPSAEIYGGFAGFWDFGHLGVELKNNIKKEWWNFHVKQREDIVGIDGAIITNPKVWEASGHVDSFNDVLVFCKKCKKPDKVDKYEIGKVKCECGGEFDWDNVKEIEQMFKTEIGLDSYSYLRPETAQLIFTNFKSVQDNARLKLPFGIAQIGKAFRNEIAPRDFLFRLREFEQMEIEYFADSNQKCAYKIPSVSVLVYSAEAQRKNQEPVKMKIKEALEKGIIKKDWHAYWLAIELKWFFDLGANPDNFRIRQHMKNELAHYSTDCWDLEYNFPFGWKELQGMADRADYDLSQHQEHSKTNMQVMDKEDKKFLPYVVSEPSQGVERAFLVFMFDSYFYDEERENIVLKLNPKLAPIKAAVFPIVRNNKKIVNIARGIYNELKMKWNVVYDSGGSIGRRYSRQDEIGTIIGITIDKQTLEDNTVTARDRNTTEQVRIKIKDLKESLRKAINEGANILELGKPVDTRKKIN